MAKKNSVLSRAISIPDYWSRYVNPKVDLLKEPKQACPFHNEQRGESFSYRSDKEYFSCFGACHVYGGDVVQMHMLNYKIKDYDKAEESLARLYGIALEKNKVDFTPPELHVNEKDVELRISLGKATRLAKTVDDWLELDLIMSQYPPTKEQLDMFINRRTQ